MPIELHSCFALSWEGQRERERESRISVSWRKVALLLSETVSSWIRAKASVLDNVWVLKWFLQPALCKLIQVSKKEDGPAKAFAVFGRILPGWSAGNDHKSLPPSLEVFQLFYKNVFRRRIVWNQILTQVGGENWWSWRKASICGFPGKTNTKSLDYRSNPVRFFFFQDIFCSVFLFEWGME